MLTYLVYGDGVVYEDKEERTAPTQEAKTRHSVLVRLEGREQQQLGKQGNGNLTVFNCI